MHNIPSVALLLMVLSSIATGCASKGKADTALTFTVSIPDTGSHYIDMTMDCKGVSKDGFLVKLPAWAPGYYNIMDFAKNVVDFVALSPEGDTLSWTKQQKNGWLIQNGDNDCVSVHYKVWADAHSVAESYLCENSLFLAPNGVFMYPDGGIQLPSEIRFVRVPQWKSIVTGLQKVESASADTLKFHAKDFDVLYDSPFFWGNPRIEDFELDGHSYELSLADSGSLDIPMMVEDLKKVISAATDIMQDIPYDNYAFILMGAGGGGLEHRNSQASFIGGNPSAPAESYMSFLGHEYFHLYNVKSIRPIALGPFNYDGECYTNLLWLSEGATVFYEHRLLLNAGLIDKDQYLAEASRDIRNFERYEGKDHMTLARSSYDTWLYPPFVNQTNVDDISFSYYDKGAAVTLLFDSCIRTISGGERSFDDVMRYLYNEFYKKLGRGFTDEELNESIVKIADPKTDQQKADLNEIFDYIYTLKPIDYNRFLEPVGIHYDKDSYTLSWID